MFVTIDETAKYTGQTVTNADITIAQALIEAYIGRVEAEVDNANDKENLSKAVAYQAVYMKDNAETVFKQIDAASVANFGSTITFRNSESVYIASAARMALKNLSWRGSRTVKAGRIVNRPRYQYDWTRDDN